MSSSKEVRSTHMPLVRHIPPQVLPDVAEVFSWALQHAVDATDPYDSVQRFTRVRMLVGAQGPAAVLAAPKLRSTDATGAGHHTKINIIKRRIMRRIGRFNELRDDAMALEAPRSSEGNTEEYQKAHHIRRTITLAQEGA